METATFGAGCFWGVELNFSNIDGVTATSVGYCGGTAPNPTYEMVCTGQSGHAEVVQLEFDASKVTYETLLEAFWNLHDPTTLNRQWPDTGTQYRSAIFFHNSAQETTARESKEKLQQSGKFSRDIVTEIVAAPQYYRAEDYHQKYLEKRGMKNCH